MAKEIAKAQNELITLEFQKSAVWRNNVKFVKSTKNDFATDAQMKSKTESLQEDCARLGKLIQLQLQRRQQLHTKKAINCGKVELLKTNVLQYEREISITKQATAKIGQAPPRDPVVLRETLKREISVSNDQYVELSRHTAEQLQALAMRIEAEKQQKYELKQIELELQERIEEKRKERRMQQDDIETSVHSDIVSQIQHYEGEIVSLNIALRDFLGNNFPKIETNKFDQYFKKKRGDSNEEEEFEYLTMAQILQALMNKTLMDPEDPWLDVNEALWEPYLALLLENGLIEKNRTGTAIALADFT